MTETAEDAQKRPRGRPLGDRDARRTELLAAATTVIARAGYANASLRKVAAHAGCTTGAVTYYFATKDEMTGAVIDALFDHFDDLLAQMADSGGLREILTGYLRAIYAPDNQTALVLVELLTAARQQPALGRLVQARYAASRAGLAAILRRGQDAGTIRADIPAEDIADQLSAMGDGWSLLLPIEPARFAPARMDRLIDQTLRLFSPPKAAP